jgi:hypothetical protein
MPLCASLIASAIDVTLTFQLKPGDDPVREVVTCGEEQRCAFPGRHSALESVVFHPGLQSPGARCTWLYLLRNLCGLLFCLRLSQ